MTSNQPEPALGLSRFLAQASLSSPKTGTPPKFNFEIQHEQLMEDKLTFFQQHFTTPIDPNPEKTSKPSNRRFALLTRGSILTTVIMLIVLFAVISAAVGVTMDQRARERGATVHPSPIRAAIMDNFPDPAIWFFGGTWYAFATNNGAGILGRPSPQTPFENATSNIQLATSPDFVTWTLQDSTKDPLPIVGDWVNPEVPRKVPPVPRGNVWAPGIIQRPTDNKFVMYYAATRDDLKPRKGHPPMHCIGASVSDGISPGGPYDPINTTLACPIDKGGAIDPAAFIDKDGTLYVSYKVDGNNRGHGGLCGNTRDPIVPTPIMLQKMHPDGITAIGDPIQLLDRDDSDGPLIEAPDILRSHDGTYYLFFSSGCTRSPTYDIKYATAKSVTGPYQRARYPLLSTGDWGLRAPGSVGIHDDGDGGFNMAFHARVHMEQGRVRAMFTTKLQLEKGIARMVRNNSTA